MRPRTYRKSSDGVISVGGVKLEDLAAQYGTPLYVLDYETLVANMRAYRDALAHWGTPYYAGKAFCCRAMVELVAQEQFGLDVVSGGELYTARTAGFDMSRVLFHGNVKTAAEIDAGLQSDVGHFVIDSIDELVAVNQAAAQSQRVAPVLLRLTPGIEAHTHEFIRTGQFDSKFGLALANGIAEEAVERALACTNLRLDGFHAHIGSQILTVEPLVANAQALLQFSLRMLEQFGYWPRILDIGGGFGVQYTKSDRPPDPAVVLRRVKGLVDEWTPPGHRPPQIIVEPGRSVVAEAGLTLYRVEVVKEVPGGRVYVAVDGGMGDNIRPALYQAVYSAELDGKPDDVPLQEVSVAGRYCETGDLLIASVKLPMPTRGDLLAVWGTGAYNYAMASTYNRVPRPAVVLVRQGDSQAWIERERWEDLVQWDRPLQVSPGVEA
ncbi:MAG: diaminopimelate decarboxylase [Sulfobacillus acidophilus]|uniref:Diaminopimelate decarboxylase n=1 Tax=Sulfobacillus acidophilus TaxID=53633 RepID=A0A2T2WKU6_9FIRM|nr:MAG: diaminopimelate decarboxylase [Sulfobacillus acidophilus]